jgi:8-oxo-dGTP pyrophosphatase MutT (NUDIX family)
MIIEREAARALILTPADEILLMRVRAPDPSDFFWIAPGGGIEAGETDEQALRRELREERGLANFILGPILWRRRHTFDWGGRRIRQRERYFAVHHDRFAPEMSDPVEARVLDTFRWRPISELATSRERLTPLALAEIVARHLADGAPMAPPEWEILVD